MVAIPPAWPNNLLDPSSPTNFTNEAKSGRVSATTTSTQTFLHTNKDFANRSSSLDSVTLIVGYTSTIGKIESRWAEPLTNRLGEPNWF